MAVSILAPIDCNSSSAGCLRQCPCGQAECKGIFVGEIKAAAEKRNQCIVSFLVGLHVRMGAEFHQQGLVCLGHHLGKMDEQHVVPLAIAHLFCLSKQE